MYCGYNQYVELPVCLQMEMCFIKPENKSITLSVGYVLSAKNGCHSIY